MADINDIRPGDRVTYRGRYGTRNGTALRLEPAGWRVIRFDRQTVVPLDAITAVKRGPNKRSYRQQVLELDPRARLDGPKMIGHYRTFAVYDADNVEIGYTDGNEDDASFAWLRALSTLQGRQKP